MIEHSLKALEDATKYHSKDLQDLYLSKAIVFALIAIAEELKKMNMYREVDEETEGE